MAFRSLSVPFYYLLKNRTYVGEINHRGKIYAGEHEPLLDRPVFDAVQTKLDCNRVAGRTTGSSNAALLGVIFDDRGNVMSPSHSQKGPRRYYYYVSRAFIEGRKGEVGSVPRVAACDIEPKIFAALKFLPQTCTREKLAETDARRQRTPRIESLVERIVLGKESIQIQLRADLFPPSQQLLLQVPWKRKPGRPKREILVSQSDGAVNQRPIKAKARKLLVRSIALGRIWLQELVSGKISDIGAIALREHRCERSVSMMLSLAFLAPDIVEAAVMGTLPRGFGVTRLINLPPLWQDQRVALSR